MFAFLRRKVSRRHCRAESPTRCLPCAKSMGHGGMCRTTIINRDGQRGYYVWWPEISLRELWIGLGGDGRSIIDRAVNSGEVAPEEQQPDDSEE